MAKNIAEKHQVTLLSFLWNDQQVPAAKELEKYFHKVITVKIKKPSKLRFLQESISNIFSFSPLVIHKYFSNEMKNRLIELLNEEKFDVIHFDHLHMAQYRIYVKIKITILDEHNIEYIIWDRYCETESNFLKKAFLIWQRKKMKDYEKNIVQRFHLCLTVSTQDMQILKTLSPNTDVTVINNGVDINYFRSFKENEEPYSLVFTGSMNWLPNEDAMVYFINDIYPLIKKSVPDVKLYIVGHSPTAKINRITVNQNITVTGLVRDVRPYLNRSQVFIVPLRIGGGTRLKILEAMAMQKPVVSTAIGHEGINILHNENIITADNPEDFANSIINLFNNQQLRNKLGENGRKLVEKEYSWGTISSILEEKYIKLLNAVL